MKEAGTAAGDYHRMQVWAGQSAAMAKPIPAGDMIQEIWHTAQALCEIAITEPAAASLKLHAVKSSPFRQATLARSVSEERLETLQGTPSLTLRASVRFPCWRGGLEDEVRLLRGFDVVAPKRFLVAQVEPGVGDDRICPGFAVATLGLVRRREAAFLTVGIGRGLEENNFPVFAVQIEAMIGITERPGANALIAPFILAGSKLDAHQALRIGAIEIVSQQDGAANAERQILLIIDLFGSELVFFDLELDQAAAAELGTAVNVTVAAHWGGNVGEAGTGSGFVIAPQLLAGLGIHANDTFL